MTARFLLSFFSVHDATFVTLGGWPRCVVAVRSVILGCVVTCKYQEVQAHTSHRMVLSRTTAQVCSGQVTIDVLPVANAPSAAQRQNMASMKKQLDFAVTTTSTTEPDSPGPASGNDEGPVRKMSLKRGMKGLDEASTDTAGVSRAGSDAPDQGESRCCCLSR